MAATDLESAVALLITDTNIISDVVNEDATKEVVTPSGNIPSLRKALADNAYFQDPVPWSNGDNETNFNQLRTFTDGTVWWSPSATNINPVPMGVTPVGDSNWYPWQDRNLKNNILEEVTRFKIKGTFAAGFTYETADDVGLDNSGNPWSYTGSLPFTVVAGTVPSEPDYKEEDFSSNEASNIVNLSMYQLAFNNGIDPLDVADLKQGKGIGSNYFYLDNTLYSSTETLAANIDIVNVSTMSLIANGVTYQLYRTAKKGDVNLLSNWMPSGAIENTDCLPYLERAYSYNSLTIINDFGGGIWTMTLVDKLFDGSIRPTGLIMNQPDKTVEFEQNVKMTMSTVTTGGKYQMFGINSPNNTLVNPHVIGDKDTHTADPSAPTGQDEQGYGIRVATGAENCNIVNPTTNKFWGDGILWRNSSKGGYIQGKHYAYDCRRQGISVIQCGGLKIDYTVGEEIGVVNGAENGPWATLDVEPDQNTQSIVGLEVGTVEGINNKGVTCLLALLKLDSSSEDVDIKIGNVISKGCLRSFEPRVDNNVGGNIYINYVHGTDSQNQDFQTVCFNDSVQLTIDTLISVNCNQAGLSSSEFSTPVGIYKNYVSESDIGNIRIKSLTVVNNTTSLRHPVSITNSQGGGSFSNIWVDEIIQSAATFLDGSVHNPANAVFRTESRIRKSFNATGTLSNSQWVNTINNAGATGTVVVTVPTNYGYEGMLFECDHTDTPEFRVQFSDGLERSTAAVRSFAIGDKLLTRRIGQQWSIESIMAGQWSQGGYGYYSYGFSAGGSTANRPVDPTPWMTYFDATLNTQITYNNSTDQWVRSDDGTNA